MNVHKDVIARKVYPDGKSEEVTSRIVCEGELELVVGNERVAFNICTPLDMENLVIGRLVTEGYITGMGDIEELVIDEEAGKATLILKKNDNKRIAPASLESRGFSDKDVFILAEAFANGSKVHKITKGTHCCYLAYQGVVVYQAEDIGRHNAMDKCIGYVVKNGLTAGECMLYTTGRVPTEMVKKAIMARIPVLVSKAVPTDAGLRMAKEYNLNLICKAWPDSFEVY